MMEPGYEKPRNNKNQNDEDLLYEIEECNNTHPLDPNQFKMFRNELKLFTIKYICKIVKITEPYGITCICKEEIHPKLCDLCIYRKKCTNISLTKNKPDYVRLLTMDDLHDMATKAQCYFPDINTQKVIELKIKQLEINKFPFLYYLVTHNCFPIYKKYVVLTDENNLVDDPMNIPNIPLNYEYIFDYDDIEPEKEEVKENKRKFLEVLSDVIRPFAFKTILAVMLLFSCVFTITIIFLSDHGIGPKIFGGVVISLITILGMLGIDMF